MALTEISLKISNEYEEPLSYFISDVLFVSQFSVEILKENQILFRIYIQTGQTQAALQQLRDFILSLTEQGQAQPVFFAEFKEIQDEDWINNWKKFFKPIDIERKMRVRPPWEPRNENMLDLVINPKMGFGTGQHATTYLCLKNLLSENVSNKKIIDIGAGSGILGTGALLLGAAWADLVENDEQAIESCQETLDINGVAQQGKVYLQDIFHNNDFFTGQHYDLALINIIAEVIVEILDLKFIQQIPVLFLSGIIKERRDMVVQKARQAGFTLDKEETQEEWVFLKLTKK